MMRWKWRNNMKQKVAAKEKTSAHFEQKVQNAPGGTRRSSLEFKQFLLCREWLEKCLVRIDLIMRKVLIYSKISNFLVLSEEVLG